MLSGESTSDDSIGVKIQLLSTIVNRFAGTGNYILYRQKQ